MNQPIAYLVILTVPAKWSVLLTLFASPFALEIRHMINLNGDTSKT